MKYASLLFFAILFFLACKKEPPQCDNPRNPDCFNYDPCIDVVETRAGFGIYARANISGVGLTYLPYHDTLYFFGSPTRLLWFRADSPDMDSYAWSIGLDPRTFTDSVFHLYFDLFADFEINVRLATENHGFDSGCFSHDTGEAVMEKKLYFKRMGDYLPHETEEDSVFESIFPIYGAYHGAFEDVPDDTLTIEVYSFSGLLRAKPIEMASCGLTADFQNAYGFFLPGDFSRCTGLFIGGLGLESYSLGYLDEHDRNKLLVFLYIRDDGGEMLPPKKWIGYRVE